MTISAVGTIVGANLCGYDYTRSRYDYTVHGYEYTRMIIPDGRIRTDDGLIWSRCSCPSDSPNDLLDTDDREEEEDESDDE